MPLTWVDVADTAVKIGLGALITAVATILLPLITFRKEVYVDRRQRRLKLIEESILKFQLYLSMERAYLSASCELLNLHIENRTPTPWDQQRYDKAVHDVDERSAYREQAISNLELLGHHAIALKIRDIQSLSKRLHKTVRAATSTYDVDMVWEEYKQAIDALRVEINNDFSSAYALEPEWQELLLTFKPK